MENKVCTKCGTENNSDATICKSCGRVLYKNLKQEEMVEETNLDNNNLEIKENDVKTGNIIGIISLVLFFVFGIIFPIVNDYLKIVSLNSNHIFVYIPLISLILGIILMVYGMIKFPNNKLIKITFGIITASIILGIILFIIIIRMCAKSVSDTCSNIDSTKVQDTCRALE